MFKILPLVLIIVITILKLDYGHNTPLTYRGKHRTQNHEINSHSHSSHRSSPKQRHTIKKGYVMFPTENIYSITVPVDGTQWRCGRNATLTELKPNGRMGGIEYEIVKSEIEKTNRARLKFNITKIEKVKNSCLWQKYKHRQRDVTSEGTVANERMLFHGSPVVRQLLQTGFDERYANYHGLFGPGIYFADLSSKSHYYSTQGADGSRLLLLCRVTLGKIYVVSTGEHKTHAPAGYHSVKGDLQQNEYIIYRGEQAYPEYLITYHT